MSGPFVDDEAQAAPHLRGPRSPRRVGGLRHRGGFRPQCWRLPGKRVTAGRGADEARRPRCVSLPRRTRQRGRWAETLTKRGLFPDLEGTRKRLRTPFPGSRTGSNDHLPLWLITFREPPERPAVRGPAPFEPGRSAGGGEARASLDERARSRRQGRPALRSRGRAHAHAAGLTMPLETTTSCGRPESRICQFLALGNTRRRVPGRAVSRVPFVSPRRPSLRASSANRHSCAWR